MATIGTEIIERFIEHAHNGPKVLRFVVVINIYKGTRSLDLLSVKFQKYKQYAVVYKIKDQNRSQPPLFPLTHFHVLYIV